MDYETSFRPGVGTAVCDAFMPGTDRTFRPGDRTFPPVGGTFQGADLKCAVVEEGFPSCSRQRRCFFKVQAAEGKYFLAGISKTVRPLVARKLK